VEKEGKIFVQHSHFSVPVNDKQAAILREMNISSVRMAIRPDEVAIKSAADTNAIPAQILITEPLGGDMLVDVTLGEQKMLVKTKPNFTGGMGEQCYLTFNTERWHLFATDTGLAYF
ncbi:MAG: TOBE domain-containing protein, partial [Gammaproteobacteria bacterium]|nr:TOBE domain-containing protein [Gammaproteobacteria bacterium]